MLRIDAFSGFTQDQLLERIGGTPLYFDQYTVSANSGWRSTRASGILAAYLAGNPDMTASAVAAWAYHNGLPSDWDINLDLDDGHLLSGTIYFLDDYPLPSNFGQLFKDWSDGYDIGAQLPGLPPAPQPPQAPSAQPLAPQPTYFQPTVSSQPSPTAQPPAPQPPQAPSAQPLAPQSAPSAQPQAIPAVMSTANQTPAKAESGFPIWILIAGAILLFIMFNKKGKSRKH